MDITPDIPAGRQVVESYGGGRFRVSGRSYEGSILLFPERVVALPAAAFEEVTLEALAPVMEAAGEVEVLLLGSGPHFAPAPTALRAALRERGLGVEAMDTGAACRTYNVLLAEGRRVAAALIAVD
jgi:uncharacterized protein